MFKHFESGVFVINSLKYGTFCKGRTQTAQNKQEITMSEKSNKNLLISILTISVILFAGALYFNKTSSVDNSEVVNIIPEQQAVQPSSKSEKDLSFLEDDFIDARDPETMSKNDQIYANQAELRKQMSEIMKMAMLYKTPESVMKSVVHYQKEGNTEKVDQLINFLLKHFPDYEVPQNFLSENN